MPREYFVGVEDDEDKSAIRHMILRSILITSVCCHSNRVFIVLGGFSRDHPTAHKAAVGPAFPRMEPGLPFANTICG